MSSGDGMLTDEHVRDSLNIIENALSHLSSDDLYQAAILHNQIIQTKAILASTGVGLEDLDGSLDLSASISSGNVNVSNLPIGAIGTATTDLSSGESGDAVFEIGGGRYVANVEANGDIDNNQSVVVINEDNIVIPSSSVQDTIDVQLNGGSSYDQGDYISPEGKIPVDSVEEDSESWGFQSSEITIYDFDASIEVAFRDNEDNQRLIGLTTDQDPFSLPIQTDKIFYKKMSESESDTSFRMIVAR